jgi:hypothetical protein
MGRELANNYEAHPPRTVKTTIGCPDELILPSYPASSFIYYYPRPPKFSHHYCSVFALCIIYQPRHPSALCLGLRLT